MTTFSEIQRAYWEDHTNLRPCNHPVVQAFAKQRIELAKELIRSSGVSFALDVGCGDGFSTYFMQQLVSYVFGCDRSLTMLRRNPLDKRCLCLADAYALPFANASFDLVYCWELLHHVHDPVQVIRELARVSNRYVLIFEPNSFNLPMALFGLVVPVERGLLRFTPWHLRHLMIQAGVYHIQTLTVGCFTPNHTPEWLFGILKRMPYKWPLVGISNVALAQVPPRECTSRRVACAPEQAGL